MLTLFIPLPQVHCLDIALYDQHTRITNTDDILLVATCYVLCVCYVPCSLLFVDPVHIYHASPCAEVFDSCLPPLPVHPSPTRSHFPPFLF